MILMKLRISIKEKQIIMLASKEGGLNKCIQRQIITVRYYSAHKFILVRKGESQQPIREWQNDKGMLKHITGNAHSG